MIKVGDYYLWPDGCISVEPEKLVDWMYKLSGDLADKLHVTEMTPEIKEFNQLTDHPISVKSDYEVPILEWIIPDKYKYLDLDEFLLGLANKVENDNLYSQRLQRLSYEIWLFKELDLYEVVRTLIYVIDVLTEKKIVWGVGRGSSCSSYLLYLLGLHEVDPVKYGIDITDFIRPRGE